MKPLLKKHKVLIAEDEPTQQKILQKHLEKLEYEVLVTSNGKETVDTYLKHDDIRIVITDLEMPNKDGFDVVKSIRDHESRYTYVMVLTTVTEKKSLIKGLDLGADDFVTKPIEIKELELRLIAAKRLLRLEDHDKLVAMLSELAAIRSGEPDHHLKRTREYCYILANDIKQNHPELDLTTQQVEDISNISVLHDIGKICIPDVLLQKQGRYTAKEYEMIKEHASIGSNVLEELFHETASNYIHIGYEIVRCHHEKWDGSGYPEGLKGEEIPLVARIMALADAYDAILSRRTYKDPLPPALAETIIKNEEGKHFDPMVVEAFERNKEGFAAIHMKYPEPMDNW